MGRHEAMYDGQVGEYLLRGLLHLSQPELDVLENEQT